MEELKTKIKNLKKENNPKECEEMIREYSVQISRISDENTKNELESELRQLSCFGLSDCLKKLLEENALCTLALDLVEKYLSTTEELAEYLFTCPKSDDKSERFAALRRRLGPKLEVLGGLKSKEIDVTKDWVSKLLKEAPSFQSLARLSDGELENLCKEASRGDMEEVNILRRSVRTRNEKETKQKDDTQKLVAKDEGKNAIDEEKLEKAKALMNETKEMAKQQSEEAKEAVNEKIAEISKILQLPPDWNQHDVGLKPEQLFEQLDGIIEQLNSVVEVGEAYKSDLEVVRKASGGRALCGIYHSEHKPPTTAELPIIAMPSEVILTSPNDSVQVEYLKFSESRAATNYVHAVKSSSSNIGSRIAGFSGPLAGEINTSEPGNSRYEEATSWKEQNTSASVVQYIWIARKTFQIGDQSLELSAKAKEMARTVDDEDAARLFMQRYGSHFPAGLHTLGGVLFRIVDAESSSTQATSVLTDKAAQQLQGQTSGGLLGGAIGIGVSVSGEVSGSGGKTEGYEEKADNVSYTFSSQAMGPATTSPDAFFKLLANNSTWALIDRGSPNAYIPNWELIRHLGNHFEEAAIILENTWRDDEVERARKSGQYDKEIREIKTKIHQTIEHVLKITDFNRKLSAAKDNNKLGDVFSVPFYTSPFGYKMKLNVTLNETKEERKDNMGAYLIIMESDHDAILSWPFKKKYTITVIDQEQDEGKRKNIEKTFTPNERESYKKPESKENLGIGSTRLISHETLKTCKYIVNDTVFVKIKIDL